MKISPASLLSPSTLIGTVLDVTQSDANSAYTTLQKWYNESTGLWMPSTGWWNSANCLTVIADLAKIDSVVKIQAQSVFTNTFGRGQDYNLEMEKVINTSSYLPVSYYASHWPFLPQPQAAPAAKKTNSFLNGYYDDEGWWALAWIAVYDVTGNSQYLQTAETIFADMASAYGTTPCGGLWWDKAETYVNAIANELFLSVAAHLANRVGSSSSSYYLDWAKKEWTWFKNSGMINSQHLINDGLTNSTCKNNGRTEWSYNQGVVLGGLTELSRATNNTAYIVTAKQIADAAIAKLSDSNGILHDPCEPHCGGDGSQFKGIFTRNLQILQRASPESRYKTFLQKNAMSIWANDRADGGELSLVWSGPFDSPANASTHSSAMDALVAALSNS